MLPVGAASTAEERSGFVSMPALPPVPEHDDYARAADALSSLSPEHDDYGDDSVDIVEVEAWELEKCKCEEPRTPFPSIIPGEYQLRCLGCCRPFHRNMADQYVEETVMPTPANVGGNTNANRCSRSSHAQPGTALPFAAYFFGDHVSLPPTLPPPPLTPLQHYQQFTQQQQTQHPPVQPAQEAEDGRQTQEEEARVERQVLAAWELGHFGRFHDNTGTVQAEGWQPQHQQQQMVPHVFVHCNEGISRSPGLFALLASQPWHSPQQPRRRSQSPEPVVDLEPQ